jgi:hypothetical protein
VGLVEEDLQGVNLVFVLLKVVGDVVGQLFGIG